MEWGRLISDKRLGMEEYHDPRHHTRSDFQRDYDRLIFSSPFRRLQNKTQVFPLPGSIFVHNRLTHSLEVSSVGRSMANEVSILLRERYEEKDIRKKLYNIGDIVARRPSLPSSAKGRDSRCAPWSMTANGSTL